MDRREVRAGSQICSDFLHVIEQLRFNSVSGHSLASTRKLPEAVPLSAKTPFIKL